MEEKQNHIMEDAHQMVSPQAEGDFLDAVSDSMNAYPKEEEVPINVGERVRYFRERKGLTLADMADRTGYEEDYLRQVEEEVVSPPLGAMVKIAKALDLKMGYLLTTGEDNPYFIVRKGEHKVLSQSHYKSQKGASKGYTYWSLAHGKKNRQMEPFIVILDPVDYVDLSAHDGQEFIYILEGEMEAIFGFEDEKREILKAGDCIYYDSTIPHMVRAHGDKPATILAVLIA